MIKNFGHSFKENYMDVLHNRPRYYALKKWNITLPGKPIDTLNSILKDSSFSN